MARLRDLPMDVMITILVRFPAKPLIQFKMVCKSWFRLISDPRFARLYLDETLRQSNSNSSRLRFIFSAPYLSSAEFDTFDGFTELDHPFREIGQGIVDVVGSCHGLICLYGYDHHLTILLYNPTTRTHKYLPFFPKPPTFAYHTHFGFGYNTVSGDYKFVRVLQASEEGTTPFWSQVAVYSLRADSWVWVQDIPNPFRSQRSDGVLVDETLHWVHEVYEGEQMHRSIVCFTLCDYIFSEVPQPEYKEAFINLTIGVLDECLCLVANGLDDSDIWVMKEYGVVGSWTRLFRVGLPKTYTYFQWPIAYSRNRQELFLQLNDFRVFSLDLKTMEVKEVKVGDFPRCFHTHLCVANLMMLKDASAEILETETETDHPIPRGKETRRLRRSKRQQRRNRR